MADEGKKNSALETVDPGDIDSELRGFYRLPMRRRRRHMAQMLGLTKEDLHILSGDEGLRADQADHMVENALGVMGMPLGLCANMRVNGRDWLIPMVIEEASVVAAASHAAKLLRVSGGVTVDVSPPHMIGQLQILDVPDAAAAEAAILECKDELLASANACDEALINVGGGALDVVVRHLAPMGADDPVGPMLVVHLVVDVRDAMGANTVNTMCERLAPRFQELSGGRVRLRIISNMADRRTVKASGTVPFSALEGKGCDSARDLALGIQEASVFAERDPFRAATHNKGIMNGIDAVLVAFGQDWRAVEAGAHSFAARDGRYTALSRWRVTDEGLHGTLELPMAVGVVGGITTVHPTVQVARKVAHVKTADELASIIAAVGLAQNLSALRALAAEGIQRGHMRVHARNVAVTAGALGHEVHPVAKAITEANNICEAEAREVLRKLRTEPGAITSPDDMRRRFQALGEEYMPHILDHIEEVLTEVSGRSSTLADMCRYHMSTGGKRLRALLPLLVAETLKVNPTYLVPFGAACEMLHNATLVHDDLQDGDKVRRGQETVWSHYGTSQAINLGDAMFYYTLLLIHRIDFPRARRVATSRRLLHETLRVIEGQELEFKLKQSASPTLADYFTMVQGKTSGLFALPIAGAAELCGPPPEVLEGLQEAARHMGVLFQIQDDVLDLYADKGRDEQGSDIREGKRSILVVHALENAPEDRAQWLRQVLDRDREQTTTEEVAEATDMLREVGSLGFAVAEMERRKQQALGTWALRNHPQLLSLVEAMCDLFMGPIRPVIDRLDL